MMLLLSRGASFLFFCYASSKKNLSGVRMSFGELTFEHSLRRL